MPNAKQGTHNLPSKGKSSGSSARTPALIQAGKITEVDPLRWTCVIRTEGSGVASSRTFRDVPVGGLYLHPLGEGIYAMPEVGTLVWVCKPSEGDAAAFIVACRPYPQRDSLTSTEANKPAAPGNRPRMSPGDFAFLGRDKNGLFVRRGQLTEIFGGSLARTIYQGRTGTIHSFTQSMKLDTLGGSLRWTVDRPELDPDGHRGTRLDLKAKEHADDRSYTARVRVGKLEETAGAVLQVQVFEDGDVGEESLTETTSLSANKLGEVALSVTGSVLVDVKAGGASAASMRASKDGTVELAGASTATMRGGTAVALVAGNTQLHVGAAGVSVGTEAGDKRQVLKDLSFSSDAAAAWSEVAALCAAIGLPSTNIAKHIAALNAATYTSTALETE